MIAIGSIETMRITQNIAAADGKVHAAELISSHRITPESSREEVRQLHPPAGAGPVR